MADQIPPSYSITAEVEDLDVSPPTYTAPTRFNIGSQRTSEPLVNMSQVKGHLALLHAFAELKKQVEGLQEAIDIPHMPADLERRWAWFVAMAVERSAPMFMGRCHLNNLYLSLAIDLIFGATGCTRRMGGRVWR